MGNEYLSYYILYIIYSKSRFHNRHLTNDYVLFKKLTIFTTELRSNIQSLK